MKNMEFIPKYHHQGTPNNTVRRALNQEIKKATVILKHHSDFKIGDKVTIE